MSQPTIGHWTWVELMTRNRAQAEAFYGALLGWTFTYDEARSYGMASNGSRMVAGLFDFSQMDDLKDAHPNWAPYLEVADVDAAVLAGEGAGGATHRAPWDIPGIGRMSVVADAGGAFLNIMRGSPSEHPQPPRSESSQVGDWHWWELRTKDTAAAKDYYGALTGGTWSFVPGPFDGMNYPIAMVGEATVAGVMSTVGVPGLEEAPEHWAGFVAVENVAAAMAAGLAAGGTTVMPPETMPQVGTFAMIADPEGAVLGIMTPSD